MMATRQQIKDTILKVAGNPVSGPIAALADDMAKAILDFEAELDTPISSRGKEKRIVEPTETRVVQPGESQESDDK